MTNPIVYEIRIKEQLGEEWANWFAPLVIHNDPHGGATLTGPLRDQSELFGFLMRLHDLNIPLISVNRVMPTDGDG